MPLPQWFTDVARELNNWGRWGEDDPIGTLNLITPEVVRRGVACAVEGKVFPLGLPLSADGIQLGFIPGRVNPIRTMIQLHHPGTADPDGVRYNDDMVVMGLQAATHWDALGHVSYSGRVWNGFGDESITAEGALRCGIDKVRSLVSRGVLLDVPRAMGAEHLEGGYAITAADLDAAEDLAGVRVEPGDVVLVRTGQMRHLRGPQPNKMAYAYPSPGLTVSTARWFRARDVAAVAIDTMVFDVYPGEFDAEVFLPVHLLHLVEMGLTQGQNFVLDELAADCAADGRYAFLLDATPLPFVNGLGSPVNPVAVK